jgi:catecholate siderophore receptor
MRLTNAIFRCLLSAAFLVAASHAETVGQTLKGVVLDPTGSPVAGARIVAVPEARAVGPATTSGPDGRFTLNLEPGRYFLRVSAEAFRSDLRTLDVLAGPGASSIEITLQLHEFRESVTVSERVGYQAVTAYATKMPTLLVDTPQAISVVSAQQIRDLSMQNMADVVRYTPGITMAQGEGHRDAPVIRGNVTTADFYVDGFRDDAQYLRDLYSVERVEAIKGANALTFGRGGGGGVLNRVTKTANFLPLREVVFQGGTYNNRRFTSDWGHVLGERLALRVAGMYENSDSYRHDVNLERYGVLPSLLYQATDRTHIRLRYERFHNDLITDRGIPSYRGRPAPAHPSTFFGDPRLNTSFVTVNLGLASIEHQRGVWNIRSSFLAGDYDKFYQNILPGSVNADATLVTLTGYNAGTLRRNFFNQNDANATLQTGSLRHTILIGSEFGRQRSNNLRNTAFFDNGATSILVPFSSPNVRANSIFRQVPSDADNRPVLNLASVFFQDQIAIGRHLQVVGGVRYDYFDMNFTNNRNNEFLARTDHLVSPRLGLVVKPMGQLSIYGSYSVSYLPSSGEQFASLDATTRNLKPEKFNNYETGLKWDFTRRLSLTTALYRLDRTNTTAPDPNTPGLLVQTGSQRTNGLEVSLNGSLLSRWTVAGGYAWQDAFLSSRTTAGLPGQKIAIVPSHSLSFWNNFRLLARLSAGLGIIRQGDMFAGIDNRVVLPSFTRLDTGLFYSLTEGVRLQANAENILNTTYYPTAHNNNNILPGSPFALRLGLIIGF